MFDRLVGSFELPSMGYIISAVFVTLLTLIGLHFWRARKAFRYWKNRGIPHEMPSILFLYYFYTKPLHDMYLEQYRKHGRIYGSYESQNPVLTVCEPDLLRDILVKDFQYFNYRRDLPGEELLGKMVSLLKGEDWKRVRTIITPAFTSKKMRRMSHIMNQCSKTVVETFGKYADLGTPAECKSIFGAYVLDVIGCAAFATKIDSLNDPDNLFVKNAKDVFATPPLWKLLAYIFLPTWMVQRLGISFFTSLNFFKSTVLQVIKERREKGQKYDDMLQMLLDAQDELENEKSVNTDIQEDEADQFGSVTHNALPPKLKYRTLSENEVISQCVMFLAGGYDTTASTFAFMIYSLTLNPECQDKLIEEVDGIFEKHSELNYDVVRDMKYLDLVLSETLRMYPPLTRSERTACADYKLGNTGLTIEKGTIVGFNIQAMHLDPEFFPNPEKFDPDRFSPENANHHQYAYLPFGAGPRNCLGMRFAVMEIKLCVCHVLRNYKFKKAPNTPVPLVFTAGQALLTVKELPLIVERRNFKK